MAVGAIEPQFFAALLAGLELSADEVPGQFEIGSYSTMFDVFTKRFASKTRDEWAKIFDGTDACVTPVLTWSEAAVDPHLTARATVVNAHGVDQAAPAPRFSRTPPAPVGPIPQINHIARRNRLVIRALNLPRCVASLVISGRTSIARDRHRRAAGSDPGGVGRRRVAVDMVAGAQADSGAGLVLRRSPASRESHHQDFRAGRQRDPGIPLGPELGGLGRQRHLPAARAARRIQPPAGRRRPDPGALRHHRRAGSGRCRRSSSGGRARSCSTPRPRDCAIR